ncbi:hypothetical protein [Nocardia callitridis]
MPWTPYYRKQHVEHGFLVTEGRLAFDAYRTITEYGEAVPKVLEHEEWREVPTYRSLILSTDGPPEHDDTDAEPAVVYDPHSVRRYLDDVTRQRIPIDQLSTDTWLMARARKVNQRYAHASRLPVLDAVARSVDAWAAASEAVYIALRRSRRGRGVPTSYMAAIGSALDTDRALVERWGR